MKVPEASDSPLERLRKKLYEKKTVETRYDTHLSQKTPGAPEAWKHAPELPQPTPKKRIPGAVLFLIGAVAFFAIAGIATAVVLFLGGRSVSSDNVEIIIEGPTTVKGGEIASLLVTLKNNNPVAVTGGTLTLIFPDGAFNPDAESETLRSVTETIGNIEPGASDRVSVRASFLGTEGDTIVIPFSFEYRTEGSNAVFMKKKQYEVVLGTAPVTLTLDSVGETSSGQPVTLTATVRSNVAGPLQNVGVKADYPFGFSPTIFSPNPSPNGLFMLGTLQPGEEKDIRITGTLSGVDGDERVFKFTAGTLTGTSTTQFAISYAANAAIVKIARPFLSVGLELNRDATETPSIRSGEAVQAQVVWTNSLSAPVLDAVIAVALSGDAFDENNVDTADGFYRSLNRTVIFDSESNPELARLEPGESGSGSFIFTSKSGEIMEALRNPTMSLAVSISGRRVGQGNVSEQISSTISRTVKVQTNLALLTRAVRTTGPYQNSGPWPPSADTESTYTILLAASNSVNVVASGAATMTLPSYVRFIGKATPGITYNETTRTVTWSIGDIAAGAKREGAFQVAFLPSTSQKGTSPILVSEARIVGFDRFVQKEVAGAAPALSTQITSDPAYTVDKGSVE